MLVDEIDLHLHPSWQRTLMTHLSESFPNVQFIVTAHSPLVGAGVQSAPNANIALLRREGDHVVIDNDVDAIRNWRVDQIYTGLFGVPTRPPEVEEMLAQRQALLTKPKLTAADRKTLSLLDAKIGVLPVGETWDEVSRLLKLAEESQELVKRLSGRKK